MNYLDILPEEFKNVKRGVIIKNILNAIEYAHEKTGYSLVEIARLTKRCIEEERKVITIRGNGEESDNAKQWLWQQIDSYIMRKRVQRGDLCYPYDMKDGWPLTDRGCLCYLYTPIKGKLEGKVGETITLFNPRSKKDVELEIVDSKMPTDWYRNTLMLKCVDSDGKEYFLIEKFQIDEAWDALYPSNKEIYWGWWNKVLEVK